MKETTSLLSWLWDYKAAHKNCSLVTSEEYDAIVQLLQEEVTKGRDSKGQMGSAGWRNKLRMQGYVLEEREGEEKVYKVEEESERNPHGRLRPLKIQDIPEALHELHVNVLMHSSALPEQQYLQAHQLQEQ